MTLKSGHRFSEKVMRNARRMIPESGSRFPDLIKRNHHAR